jgi:phage anti-repressor protein
MSEFNEFAVEDELLKVNRSLNDLLDISQKENELLRERWEKLREFLKGKTSMHCSEPRHYQDKSLFMDVVVKMDELEK